MWFFKVAWWYILISGMKLEKYFHQFQHFVIPPMMKFSKIGPKSKIEIVWIFFQKTKCTNSGDKNPEGQVCNPKNIAIVEGYFSNFPNGTPCTIHYAHTKVWLFSMYLNAKVTMAMHLVSKTVMYVKQSAYVCIFLDILYYIW